MTTLQSLMSIGVITALVIFIITARSAWRSNLDGIFYSLNRISQIIHDYENMWKK